MGRKKLPRKQRKDIIIGVRCDAELKRKLDETVAAAGGEVTLVQVIRAALRQYVEKAAT